MIVVVGAYIDESSDEQAEEVFSLAGYVAPTVEWVYEFEPKWEAKLREHNLQYFRAAECQSGIGQFLQFRLDPSNPQARLTPDEKKRLTEIKKDFVGIAVEQAYMWGFGVNVILKDFRALIESNPAAKAILGDEPYLIGYQILLSKIGLTVKEFNDALDPHLFRRHMVGFVFDKGDRDLHARAREQYDRFQIANPESATWMASRTEKDDKLVYELQAADNLAFEVRKSRFNRLRYPDIPERPALTRLKHNLAIVYNLDRRSLELLVAQNLQLDTIPTHKIEEI